MGSRRGRGLKARAGALSSERVRRAAAARRERSAALIGTRRSAVGWALVAGCMARWRAGDVARCGTAVTERAAAGLRGEEAGDGGGDERLPGAAPNGDNFAELLRGVEGGASAAGRSAAVETSLLAAGGSTSPRGLMASWLSLECSRLALGAACEAALCALSAALEGASPG